MEQTVFDQVVVASDRHGGAFGKTNAAVTNLIVVSGYLDQLADTGFTKPFS